MLKKIVQYSALILLLVPVLLFWFAYQADNKSSNDVEEDSGQISRSHDTDNEKSKGKKIKYWVAPMDPNYIRNEPGKSPMGMDLVPVYEDEDEKSSEGIIRIDPVTVQTIGIRTASVSRGQLRKSIRAAGRIAYDEKLVEHIHTKVSGWVEKLYVQTTGEEVKKGQELLTFYSP
ncbi:MAG: efflux RND transporter periplasmic adaptor subunit, partial [Nitrospiraceae bacterium]